MWAVSRGPTSPPWSTSSGSWVKWVFRHRGHQKAIARCSSMRTGLCTNSICCTIRGSTWAFFRPPPQPGHADSVYSQAASSWSAVNDVRSCLACPGWPPALRLPVRRVTPGFGAFTMSLDGGFELVEEFLRDLASAASSSALRCPRCCTRSSNASTRSISCSTKSTSCRFDKCCNSSLIHPSMRHLCGLV